MSNQKSEYSHKVPHYTQLTPAQANLLEFISHLEADSLYESLSTTLSVCISDYLDRPDPDEHPTRKVLEAWYFTLQIMLHIHSVAAEKPKAEH